MEGHESSARITITVNPRMIERIIYWIIIIVLAVLLIMAYLGNDGSSETKTESESEETNVPAEVPVPTPAPTPTASCTDGIKNQDETDVDCGGSCGTCASGKACTANADCSGGYCVANKCSSTAPVTLSGSVDVKVTAVKTADVPSSGAVRVTEVTYEITNGLEDDLGLINVQVYLKSKRDTKYCLNQNQGDEIVCDKPFASWTLTGPKSGKTFKESKDLQGAYTAGSIVANYGSSTYYANGDEFNLFLYVFDADGEEIDGETINAFKAVKP